MLVTNADTPPEIPISHELVGADRRRPYWAIESWLTRRNKSNTTENRQAENGFEAIVFKD